MKPHQLFPLIYITFLTITSIIMEDEKSFAGGLLENSGNYMLAEVPDSKRIPDIVAVEKEDGIKTLIKVDAQKSNIEKEVTGYVFNANTTCDGGLYSLDGSKANSLKLTIAHCNNNKDCSMVMLNNCDESDPKYFYCINGSPKTSQTACSWAKKESVNDL